MILILQIIFWASLFFILFSYLFYPAILKVLSTFVKKPDLLYTATDQLPRIFVIIAVFNEKKVIGEKIKSLFNSNYPSDKISIIIGSDASDDGTEEIVKEFQKKKPTLN